MNRDDGWLRGEQVGVMIANRGDSPSLMLRSNDASNIKTGDVACGRSAKPVSASGVGPRGGSQTHELCSYWPRTPDGLRASRSERSAPFERIGTIILLRVTCYGKGCPRQRAAVSVPVTRSVKKKTISATLHWSAADARLTTETRT
ncbi:MAG: hypothetical protein CMJ59_16120 [Planctomycetaceae bacterium]|nr:hypothetical protein [Planctomycetaceae bacterium]